MADSQQQNPGSSINTFSKGMIKDYNDTFIGEGLYTHARNATTNSHDGQIGVIGNEPSNLRCVTLPYTFIGAIHLLDDQWAVYTTNDIDSEIGIFDESACSYVKIVNDRCLGFKRSHLITGAFRKRYDCERIVYWDDGLNPTRSMDLDKVPWKQICTTVNNCTTCIDTNVLDCEKLRIASFIKHPCISIKKGYIAGTLPNGTYQACIAYTVNQVRVTDYIGLTNPQGLFSHENTSSSLEIKIETIDETFDEFELVIVSNVNAQSVAKRIGYYSTSQGVIYVDRWNTEYVSVNVGDVVFRSEPIEKSDAMYTVNNYLLRVGTYSKFKFNYQPQANNIGVTWAAVQYPSDYYIKGNNNTGYMRDEVYAFFIRFVYNTGELSESYHIPGRLPITTGVNADTANITGGDAFEPYPVQRWQVENTSSVTSTPNTFLPDGGKLIAEGKMAYWQSTEKYPDNRPDIWGPLCGQNIRHHKMPDETKSTLLSTFNTAGANIVLLGVEFDNITAPLDLLGNPITSVVGYEILRGSREGNKSIIAKGLINNMRDYKIPGSTVKGLYQNYPYNDLTADRYLTPIEQNGENGGNNDGPISSNVKNIFSFHGPDVTFSNPYLNPNEIKVYEERYGTAIGSFTTPYKHPKFKQLTTTLDNALNIFTIAVVAGQAAATVAGAKISTNIGADKDLPFTELSAEWVGGGSFGIIADVSAIAATVANIITYTAYQILIGGKVIKQQLAKLVLALIPKRQYAAQYTSWGFYNNSRINISGNRRRAITQSNYVGSNIQQFTTNYQINNLNRSKVVVLQTGSDITPTSTDLSRFTISSRGNKDLNKVYPSDISSYYAALKIPIPSQYGQLDSIKQLPVSTCMNTLIPDKTLKFNTSVLFGGDVYINRFTEKNTMFFFTDWLMGEPDEIEYDYTKYINIPYTKYWINNTDLVGIFTDKVKDHRNFDYAADGSFYFVNRGYFYLFNSGVRDFFVESEVNVAYRDWEEDTARRHYDPYNFTDLQLMFRSDIIRSGNYYKYDYNLSISKLFNSHISWGNLLPRDYFPDVYSTCYTYRPNRVIYSLPQQDQAKKDSWRAFLTNNYKDFMSPVTAIKQVNKTGALFMMKFMSPLQFMGVEELKLDGTGAKITIGDAGLFTGPQQLQAIVNADDSYEYASNQGRYCSINTMYGVFWVSQNQGKIFQYGGQLSTISNDGLKWWFAKYLPSNIVTEYPDYPLQDNPVIGVGVQMIYDNSYDIIYVTKKDYKPKVALTYAHPDTGKPYDKNGQFYLSSNTPISLTDTNYFENASWTMSYDPKTKTWVSFHDWIPTFLIPGKNHFMTVNSDSIWKHNQRCDSYCNFYGVDHPFEIEFVSATGQTVNTMRSVEYLLEVYNYSNDCRDKFHVLDQNFDQAIIYNSEQISGLLELTIKQKNNPLALLAYPQIGPSSIKIQFSKEENKYRFNQFWDITNNRGEYIPNAIPMFITESNGYKYNINQLYVNYNKSPLERKKFRHNVNRVFLRKFISGNNKLLFKISNQKLLQSPR